MRQDLAYLDDEVGRDMVSVARADERALQKLHAIDQNELVVRRHLGLKDISSKGDVIAQ